MLGNASARADSGAAEARFVEARAAFDAEDFSSALQLFEECLALGMQGPAVHFNIGVAAYHSGDFQRADRAFRAVAETPAMAALAHYNLGLVALKRDDEQGARRWFERAAREATDERLATLAARRLDGLPKAPTSVPWSLYARGGAGYDDNVALRSESINTAGSGEEDSFSELLVAGSYSFLPSWRVDAATGLFRYSNLDEFNQTALSFGVTRGMALEGWHLELGGYATQLSLGGDVYERSVAAGAQASTTFRQLGTLRAHLRISAIDGAGAFSGLSGTRSSLGLQYEWAWRALGFVAHARAEFNDSQDEVFASRWLEAGAEVRWAASPLWSFAAETSLRSTRHPAQSTQDPWDDRRVTLRLEATRTLWRQAQLFVRYEHERNESPIDTYDYDRNRIAASIEIWR
ncbi:MAG: tetratricopeptide repeat protein [Pseudomonadota bacterium]